VFGFQVYHSCFHGKEASEKNRLESEIRGKEEERLEQPSVVTIGGSGPPRLTPSRGDTRMTQNCKANLQRIVDKRGRTGKKGVG